MNEEQHPLQLSLTRLAGSDEARTCAELMSSSEPWTIIGRPFEECLNIINDHVKEVFIARAQGEFAGFIVINMHGTFSGYIQSICVRSEWRNQGLGRQLIHFAEERIFRDSPNVFMCVSSFNQNAYRLYQRLGYETVGEFKDYIVRGHSEILLRKTIAPLSEFKKKK